ncbi:hypothetical protein S70_14420 [Providencia stuartii MRSN 2154]|uniref:Uncharacterized protein n=1 Tax=Providencia stuartii (strain MRSN 2154) TaxID=1157951 RepID=A0A140NNL7_PROSM|nr:hypothetical protein S70_14420 [Providencia stuartii MRSN 2154]
MKIISLIILFLGLLNFHQAIAKNTSSGLRFPNERLVFHQESRGLSFLLKIMMKMRILFKLILPFLMSRQG